MACTKHYFGGFSKAKGKRRIEKTRTQCMTEPRWVYLFFFFFLSSITKSSQKWTAGHRGSSSSPGSRNEKGNSLTVRENMKIPPLYCLSPFSWATASKQSHGVHSSGWNERLQDLNSEEAELSIFPTLYPPISWPQMCRQWRKYKTKWGN